MLEGLFPNVSTCFGQILLRFLAEVSSQNQGPKYVHLCLYEILQIYNDNTHLYNLYKTKKKEENPNVTPKI